MQSLCQNLDKQEPIFFLVPYYNHKALYLVFEDRTCDWVQVYGKCFIIACYEDKLCADERFTYCICCQFSKKLYQQVRIYNVIRARPKINQNFMLKLRLVTYINKCSFFSSIFSAMTTLKGDQHELTAPYRQMICRVNKGMYSGNRKPTSCINNHCLMWAPLAHLRWFLHLVSDVDFPELFKEAEHGQLQPLVSSLSEPRVCQVHQLQNPERFNKTEVTAVTFRQGITVNCSCRKPSTV